MLNARATSPDIATPNVAIQRQEPVKSEMITYYYLSKWFEPRSISSSCSVIVRVSVVLKRTVGDSD